MNWIVFVICAYVTLAMDRGFDLLLTFDGIGPCFTLILAVYVALRARPSTVPWAMIGVLWWFPYWPLEDGRMDTEMRRRI